MSNKNKCLSIVLGLAFVQGIMANTPNENVEEFDIDSIVLIEEELTIELGFDTAKYLPSDFDAYAFPTDVQSINYIDANDEIELNIDTEKYLPENFNAFAKN